MENGVAKGTSASLITSKNVKAKDFRVKFFVNTLGQLRTPFPPNAFECFWLFFNQHKEANGSVSKNYLAFKPIGLEFGTAYKGIGQTFISTVTNVKFPIGVAYGVELVKRGTSLELFKDGVSVWKYTEAANAEKPMYNAEGSFALYSEDAKVLVSDFQFQKL